MGSFSEAMSSFKEVLQRGQIQIAYQGLMQYFRNLKTHFKVHHPDLSVSSTLYYGYMDMTYFALLEDSLKRKGLKIALVFDYDQFRFEAWLSGANRDVQAKYWKLLQEAGWSKYRFADDPRRADYIIAHNLVEDPDFADLEQLTRKIDQGTIGFLNDVQAALSEFED